MPTYMIGGCVLAAMSLLMNFASPSMLLAWGQIGHETVGAIADQLLAGTRAEQELQKLLLSGETLMSVSVWLIV